MEKIIFFQRERVKVAVASGKLDRRNGSILSTLAKKTSVNLKCVKIAKYF